VRLDISVPNDPLQIAATLTVLSTFSGLEVSDLGGEVGLQLFARGGAVRNRQILDVAAGR
jgi:hypothetical protein